MAYDKISLQCIGGIFELNISVEFFHRLFASNYFRENEVIHRKSLRTLTFIILNSFNVLYDLIPDVYIVNKCLH